MLRQVPVETAQWAAWVDLNDQFFTKKSIFFLLYKIL